MPSIPQTHSQRQSASPLREEPARLTTVHHPIFALVRSKSFLLLSSLFARSASFRRQPHDLVLPLCRFSPITTHSFPQSHWHSQCDLPAPSPRCFTVKRPKRCPVRSLICGNFPPFQIANHLSPASPCDPFCASRLTLPAVSNRTSAAPILSFE
jgi:hypothetical protein